MWLYFQTLLTDQTDFIDGCIEGIHIRKEEQAGVFGKGMGKIASYNFYCFYGIPL